MSVFPSLAPRAPQWDYGHNTLNKPVAGHTPISFFRPSISLRVPGLCVVPYVCVPVYGTHVSLFMLADLVSPLTFAETFVLLPFTFSQLLAQN